MAAASIRVERRSNASLSFALPFRIVVNGKTLARLSRGSSVLLEVAPGPLKIGIKNMGWPGMLADVDINLKPGETATFECEVTESLTNPVKLRRTFPETTPQSVHGSPVEAHYAHIPLRETHQVEEALGVEYRTISNPSVNASMTRSLRISREWTRSWTVEASVIHKIDVGGGLGFDLIKINAGVSNEIKRVYSIGESEREEFSEEVTLQIPPSTSVLLALHWKRLWQHGEALLTVDGSQFAIPYAVATSMTFDQTLSDL